MSTGPEDPTPTLQQIGEYVSSTLRALRIDHGDPNWDKLPDSCCKRLTAELNHQYKIRLSETELHGKTILAVSSLVRRYISLSWHPAEARQP